MGKKHLSAARRAKKKHEKALKRRSAHPAPRRSAAPPARPPRPADSLLSVSRRAAVSTFQAWHPAAPPPRFHMDWQPAIEGIDAFVKRGPFKHYFQAAHTVERFNWADLPGPALNHSVWTPSRAAALTTDDLLGELARLGIDMSSELFLAATPLFASAVELARSLWVPLMPAGAGALDRDFVLLAACELWKRWCPDSPSQEMLMEPLLDGYVAFSDLGFEEAMTCWTTFWARVAPLLAAEGGTTKDVDELVGALVDPLSDWPCDFAAAALEADSESQEPLRAAARALEDIVIRLRDENPYWRVTLAEDVAIVLDELGERARAEHLLRRMIEQHPHCAGGYVALSQLWAPYTSNEREGIGRALAILEQAVAYPVDDGDDYELAQRIEVLRKKLSAAPPGSDSLCA